MLLDLETRAEVAGGPGDPDDSPSDSDSEDTDSESEDDADGQPPPAGHFVPGNTEPSLPNNEGENLQED